MLIISFVCLILIFLMVFTVAIIEGFDIATLFLFVLVALPLITITKLLFNI